MTNKDIEKYERKKLDKKLRELETKNPERADKIKKALREKEIRNRVIIYFFTIFMWLLMYGSFIGPLIISFLAVIINFFTKEKFHNILFWLTFVFFIFSVISFFFFPIPV